MPRKPNLRKRVAREGSIPRAELSELAKKAEYRGNPQHKKSRGGFILDSPPAARPEKTLCDPTGINEQVDAENLLREGLRRGAVSDKFVGDWPKQVWAVATEGLVLEAQYGDVGGRNRYHGYPVALNDPIRDQVLALWERTND